MPDESKMSLADLHKAFLETSNTMDFSVIMRFIGMVMRYAEDGGKVHTPIALINGELKYDVYHYPTGDWYVACTSTEEMVKWPGEASAVVKLDGLLFSALLDPQVEGLCINPNNEHKSFLVKEMLEVLLGDPDDYLEDE